MKQHTHSARRGSWRKLLKGSGAVLLVAVLGVGGYYGTMRWQGNFHTTIPGELYRSAQPTPSQI
ncbi:MAG: hypothetical protein J0I92_07515, partial [Phyllobacterium sp.]|nr:hypothetical protein [Phyllobacterium sp.]